MDRIKKLKIKKQDGTFSDYIPIGADAENIDTTDGESVQLKLNKKPYYYNTVADMKADTKLKVGDMAVTLGYYSVNDGGGAEYRIVSTSNMYIEALNNNLKAELIIKKEVNVKQLGAYGDGIHNDTNAIQNACDYFENIFIYKGVYIISHLNLNNIKTNIIGQDKTLTIIKFLDNQTSHIININSTDVTLKNLCINANQKTGHIFTGSAVQFANYIIKDCSFTGTPNASGTYALNLNHADTISILNNSFTDLGGTGVGIAYSKNVYIKKNYFNNLFNTSSHREANPMYIAKCSNIVIIENICKNFEDSGLYCDRGNSHFVNISHNIIENCGKEAIKNQTMAQRTIISGNIINNARAQGIAVGGCGMDTIISNNIIHNVCLDGDARGTRVAAIALNPSHNTIIEGNEIKYVDNDHDGIWISHGSHHTILKQNNKIEISNNIIDTVSRYALWIQDAKNVNISNNILSNPCCKTTSYKYFLFLNSVTGSLTNNIFTLPDTIDGHCSIIDSTHIQMPLGFPKNENFIGKNISIFYREDVQDTDDFIFSTIITNYDMNTKIITLQEEINLERLNANDYIFTVETVSNPVGSIRYYGNINYLVMGNKLYGNPDIHRIENPSTVTLFPATSTEIETLNQKITQ